MKITDAVSVLLQMPQVNKMKLTINELLTEIAATRAHFGGHGVGRQPGDVCLSRVPHCSVPLKIAILVRADGQVVDWYADWTRSDTGAYWQFDHELIPRDRRYPERPPTAAQREAIAKLFFRGHHAGGSVGAPAQEWCHFNGPEELEALGNSGRKSTYA